MFTLNTVKLHSQVATSSWNPTPLGYTVRLMIYLVPVLALS